MTALSLRRIACITGTLLCSAVFSVPSAHAQSAAYRYTRIASTATDPAAGLNGVYCAGMNNQGRVVVHTSGAGASALWKGNGGPFTAVEAQNVGGLCPSINDAGDIAYVLVDHPVQSVTSLVRNTAGTKTVLARNDLSPFLATSTYLPSLNASGHVVFHGGQFGGEGIYIAPSGTAVYDPGGAFHPLTSTFAASMNDSDVVVFRAQALPSGAIGIYRGSLTPLVEDLGNVAGGIIRIGLEVPVINNHGTVAFVGSLNGVRGIYTTNDGFNMALVGTGPLDRISINDSGQVVYRRTLSGGAGSGIYVGRAGAIDRPVIEQGQTLDGSTVQDAFIWEDSLNDEAQVVFWAHLADGRQGIYRAEPPTVVNVTANGSDGPVTLNPGAPLLVEISADVSGVRLATAIVALGVATPSGVLWIGPAGFTSVATALYSGPLPDFGPVTLFNFPSTAGFPPGTYKWFMIVFDPSTSAMAFDLVATVVP